jgi:hypothetical protein
MWPLALFPFLAMATAFLYLYARGVREEIETKAPDFSLLLYRKPFAWFTQRTYPFHVKVLLFEPAPTSVVSPVRIMRALFVAQAALLAGCVISIVF